MKWLAIACALAASCATTDAPHVRDIASASALTLDAVRRSPVQGFVKEAPSVVRAGIARLVTLVPLDETKSKRLGAAVGAAFVVDRLLVETAMRFEQSMTPAQIAAFAAALESASVATVIAASVAHMPDAAAIERFVDDPTALPEARRARVKALVDASWSSTVLDGLSRAPVAAAGRSVAAALGDDDDERRAELLRIAYHGRPTDPDALIVAFAFLWRDIDTAVLDEASAYFTSAEGRHATQALLAAATSSLEMLAAEVEHTVAVD